ncbi:MAG: purine-binding chemotaxis protein CheW [Hydrococcus sp. C42_A2020_068]|uniref:chemotaxis protein CheW n=1 Tax=Pleurocapsa sp. PCC 7327 TaxID=118163 RepID=UPI00029FD415|nr:chemotaxis protein CheW [Pleurocapsa sp. PCC 7327]AFY76941.1 chemotaxis signal transduction protein [Pleurocapsa sp. PCC 7327]MBF2019512.1 purine-binding chemotaxis protein CheW [Hydrococcus sp. C42_A2020_068]
MNLSTLNLQSNRSQKAVGQAYLKFQLDAKTQAALSMDAAQEVLIVPSSRLTFMPNMPYCVLGLLNQRSRVYWVVDLPQLLEMPMLPSDTQQYNITIARSGNMALALAVLTVRGVTRFLPEAIQSPIGTVAPGLTPYLQGLVPQEREILLVLDPEAILNSTALNANR